MGSLVFPSETQGFQGLINTMWLTPFRSAWWHLTWYNKQDARRRVHSKIDRALGRFNWIQ